MAGGGCFKSAFAPETAEPAFIQTGLTFAPVKYRQRKLKSPGVEKLKLDCSKLHLQSAQLLVFKA